MSSPDGLLPDYRNPPVTEIIAAVQFAPVPLLGVEQIVALGRELSDWRVVETGPAIPPMSEGPTGEDVPQAFMTLGTPPARVLLATEDSGWFAQFQQDRIAVHERKVTSRPSFRNVAPRLKSFAAGIGRALGVELFSDSHAPDMVEVIYQNRIAASDGGWSDFNELHRVLRVFSERPGEPPYDRFEQPAIAFSYLLVRDETFVGRLRVAADPHRDEDGRPVLSLRLVSRRFVGAHDLDDVMEACHADIVKAFTAITTSEMHERWERFR